MSEPFVSPRFSLPLLAAGQAQKEITHNEALSIADALLHPAVESDALVAPPHHRRSAVLAATRESDWRLGRKGTKSGAMDSWRLAILPAR